MNASYIIYTNYPCYIYNLYTEMKEFYLARNSQGGLALFNQKPTKKTYIYNEDFPEHKIEIRGWTTPEYEKYGRGFLVVDRELYPEITYENSPKKVIFKIE